MIEQFPFNVVSIEDFANLFLLWEWHLLVTSRYVQTSQRTWTTTSVTYLSKTNIGYLVEKSEFLLLVVFDHHAFMCRLSSAVAEHRRAVRPSRRTQGSRNPLRALAARDDIRQDYMGERDNNAAEERGQAEKSELIFLLVVIYFTQLLHV